MLSVVSIYMWYHAEFVELLPQNMQNMHISGLRRQVLMQVSTKVTHIRVRVSLISSYLVSESPFNKVSHLTLLTSVNFCSNEGRRRLKSVTG